jgi:hypothetical protein
MNLEAIQLQLQDLSCSLSYSTKQDLHISLDFQQTIGSALQVLEKVLNYSAAFLTLNLSGIKDMLIQQISDTPEKYNEITDILDALDELESHLVQINIMQDTLIPNFGYRETIQPFNQV